LYILGSSAELINTLHISSFEYTMIPDLLETEYNRKLITKLISHTCGIKAQ